MKEMNKKFLVINDEWSFDEQIQKVREFITL